MKAILYTGRWKNASPADREILSAIFGKERLATDFPLYFYWFNVVHELGHVLMRQYAKERIPREAEEQLVTDFAVAYWRAYGEPDKLATLEELVTRVLPRFQSPDTDDLGHLAYAAAHWDDRAFFTFNNYGWFQFHCTADALRRARHLPDVLAEMGLPGRSLCSLATQVYDLSEPDVAFTVVKETMKRLACHYQVTFPEQWEHRMADDPNRHAVLFKI